jgi:hypothetical protein
VSKNPTKKIKNNIKIKTKRIPHIRNCTNETLSSVTYLFLSHCYNVPFASKKEKEKEKLNEKDTVENQQARA